MPVKESYGENAGRNGNNNVSNSSIARAAMVPKGIIKEYSGPNFTYKNRKDIAEPRLTKTPSDGKQSLKTNGLGSFTKKLIAEE